MVKANIHVSNINRLLKGVKSEIFIEFIHSNNKRLLITTNKVAAISNLNIIEKYIKDLNNVDLNDIISPGLLQSKSYLKIICHIYKAKYPKCNELHKLENHRDIAWCCKANFETNLLRLKTPKEEPCLHLFKYVNCKGNHQADSYNCPLQKYKFNYGWHSKKSQKL